MNFVRDHNSELEFFGCDYILPLTQSYFSIYDYILPLTRSYFSICDYILPLTQSYFSICDYILPLTQSYFSILHTSIIVCVVLPIHHRFNLRPICTLQSMFVLCSLSTYQ